MSLLLKLLLLVKHLQDSFKEYAQNIISNASHFAEGFKKEGINLFLTGRITTFCLWMCSSLGLTGKVAEKVLDEIGITVNKNTIPFDPESPFVTSGIRIGTAALQAAVLVKRMDEIASLIAFTLKNHEDEAKLEEARRRVEALTSKFALYPEY